MEPPPCILDPTAHCILFSSQLTADESDACFTVNGVSYYFHFMEVYPSA